MKISVKPLWLQSLDAIDATRYAIDATRPGPRRYTTFLSSFNEEMKISNVVLADKTVLNCVEIKFGTPHAIDATSSPFIPNSV